MSRIINFKKFITESSEQLSHLASGEFNIPEEGGHGIEHAYHTTIPTNNGSINLFIGHVERPSGTENLQEPHHELHFAVTNISPEDYHESQRQMRKSGHKHSEVPHQVFYNIPNAKSEQLGYASHGPATMFHVMRHMTNVLSTIPSGHKIVIDAAGAGEKISAYSAMANRVVRDGIVKRHENLPNGSIVLERT